MESCPPALAASMSIWVKSHAYCYGSVFEQINDGVWVARVSSFCSRSDIDHLIHQSKVLGSVPFYLSALIFFFCLDTRAPFKYDN